MAFLVIDKKSGKQYGPFDDEQEAWDWARWRMDFLDIDVKEVQ